MNLPLTVRSQVPLDLVALQVDPFGIGEVPTLFVGLVVLVVALAVVRVMINVAIRLLLIAFVVLALLWVGATLGFDVPVF